MSAPVRDIVTEDGQGTEGLETVRVFPPQAVIPSPPFFLLIESSTRVTFYSFGASKVVKVIVVNENGSITVFSQGSLISTKTLAVILTSG